MPTLAQRYAAGRREHADRPAVADPVRTLTYRELGERAGRLAAGLAGLGVDPGDRVLTVLANSCALLELEHALVGSGSSGSP